MHIPRAIKCFEKRLFTCKTFLIFISTTSKNFSLFNNIHILNLNCHTSSTWYQTSQDLVFTNSLGLWYEPWTFSLKANSYAHSKLFWLELWLLRKRGYIWKFMEDWRRFKIIFWTSIIACYNCVNVHYMLCVFKMRQTVFYFLYIKHLSCLAHYLLMAYEIPLITFMAEWLWSSYTLEGSSWDSSSLVHRVSWLKWLLAVHWRR